MKGNMLRTATINIDTFSGDDGNCQEHLAGKLRKEQLDILCCQQVPYTQDRRSNTSALLAEKLGMACSFTIVGDRASRRGAAILSGQKTCMLYSGSLQLPGSPPDKEQTTQFAVIRKEGDAVLVLNLHQSSRKKGKNQRREQLQMILSHPIMEKHFAAILLCGNFRAGMRVDEFSSIPKRSPYAIQEGFVADNGTSVITPLGPLNGKKGRRVQQGNYIFVLKERRKAVAGITCGAGRCIFSQTDFPGSSSSYPLGLSLDLSLSRIQQKEMTSQIRRYASFSQSFNTVNVF